MAWLWSWASPYDIHNDQKDGRYQLTFPGTHAHCQSWAMGEVLPNLLQSEVGVFSWRKVRFVLLEEGQMHVVQSKAIFMHYACAHWALQPLSVFQRLMGIHADTLQQLRNHCAQSRKCQVLGPLCQGLPDILPGTTLALWAPCPLCVQLCFFQAPV